VFTGRSLFIFGSFVECQRGRQVAELGDLPLKSGDRLLSRSDRVGPGDEAQRGLLPKPTSPAVEEIETMCPRQ
jgi:hypothetical protein